MTASNPDFRRPLRDELKVVLFVLGALACGEGLLRWKESALSKDVEHLRSFGEVATHLAEDAAPLHVLFLGNSMTRYGLSADVFAEEFERRGGPPLSIGKCHPDNTAVTDWYYAYRNYFHEAQRAPDVLVIGFGAGHLRDQPTHHPGRLARYYCDLNDWETLCAKDLPDFEARCQFKLARVSALFSNRDRVQSRVLDCLVPHYRDSAQIINSRQSQLARRGAPSATYQRLGELIDMAQGDGVRVVLAAMPLGIEYELEAEVMAVAARENVELVDCRHAPGIQPEMFPDGVHMTADAAEFYSRHLAQQLAHPVALARSAPQRGSTEELKRSPVRTTAGRLDVLPAATVHAK